MINLRVILFLPACTYIVSYLYLAYYHGKIFLFTTVVHEGGTYTLIQSIFYASHFLGHVPTHIMLAFLFIGSYLCLTKSTTNTCSKEKIHTLFLSLVFFLILSFFLSLSVFGYEDTSSFLFQQKQSVEVYAVGGSWNLHIPSSMLLFLFIPVYLYIVKKMFGRNINANSGGVFYICLGAIFFLLFTFILNKNILSTFLLVWGDPRYLAHSVRELLTFPITYFPIPLYFLLKQEKRSGDYEIKIRDKKLRYFIVFLATVFLLGLLYQSYVSLMVGIENVAQKPDFVKGENLGIFYLLTSHYFEHFLDTIFFTIFCLFIYGLANKLNLESTSFRKK